MELRQLVYFEAVVRHGGFSHAGRQLLVAQPAISAQIRRLEAELGVTLFLRTTRRVELTEAGELLLARVRVILAELDRARGELGELTAVLRGRVRAGATPVLGPVDLPGTLAAFHRRYPGVRLSLRIGLVATLCAELDAGRLDVVLGPVHQGMDREYQVRHLGAERLVLITPPGFRPPGPGTGLARLSGEPFVCLPEGTGLRALLIQAAASAGFTPRVDYEASTPASVRDLVAAGVGIALLAESAALAPGPAVEIRQLPDGPAHPPIGCLLHRERRMDPAVRAFVEQLTGAAGLTSPVRLDQHDASGYLNISAAAR